MASTQARLPRPSGTILVSRREPIGQRQHNAAVAERLGDAAAVGADDRNAIDHGLDRDQRLVFPPERRQQGELGQAPEPARVGRVGHDLDVAGGRQVEPAGASVSLVPRLSTTSSGISGRRRPSSWAMRANG